MKGKKCQRCGLVYLMLYGLGLCSKCYHINYREKNKQRIREQRQKLYAMQNTVVEVETIKPDQINLV